MRRPIPPSNDTQPLRVGDRVRIAPQFQVAGDERFERIVVEAPPSSSRVLLRTIIPEIVHHPTEVIDAAKLVRVIDFGELGDFDPESALRTHANEMSREQRLFCVEKFPQITLESLGAGITSEEVDLCAKLHPSIALRHAADRISDSLLDDLSQSHSFAVLLHASHCLVSDRLRDLAAFHPGECIVILERPSRIQSSTVFAAGSGRSPPQSGGCSFDCSHTGGDEIAP